MSNCPSAVPFVDLENKERTGARSFLSRTPWKVTHDYGAMYYSPASRAYEHLHLNHHLLGVEISPGIVRTRRNDEAEISNVILAGALYFVGAGSTLEVSKEQPMEYLLATVDPALVEEVLEEADPHIASTGFSFNLIDQSIAGSAAMLRRMFLTHDADLRTSAAQFVQQALSRLLVNSSAGTHRARYQLTRQRLRASLEFINEHLDTELSVETIAREAASASGFHFAHAFTAALGVSPYQYILECRMARARELLMRTDRTVAEIAYAVGFSSQAHMTSVFCKRLGITPVKLRRNH